MSIDIIKLLQKKKKLVLADWMTAQLGDAGLREDLMSNEELREQSEELLNTLLKTINERNLSDVQSSDFEPVHEILGGISISRARQGFSPRETRIYIFSLKDALMKSMLEDLNGDPNAMIDGLVKISKLMDSLGVVTFETFIKGREEVILRQTDEITEI